MARASVFLRCQLISIITGLLLLGKSAAQQNEQRLSEHLVQTRNGPIQGTVEKSRNSSIEFVKFVGLRYASPPSRFEPAQPLEETWSTPKIANVAGNECPQIGETGKWLETEDCLFLNVFVPKSHIEGNPSVGLPVIVWIHGGGFAFGDGYSYDGSYFMETEDVILVTINYRLGLLGFISMDTDTSFVPNNGLRDMVMALKWVQENIGAFKGDPGKVTIAGNSAGSTAVHYLCMSSLATGLFHGAIMQSGAHCFWSYAQNPRTDATQLATVLGCPDSENPKEIRKCLEGKSVKDLLIGQTAFASRWPPSNPISRFLPTAKEPKENAFFSGEPASFFTFHGKANKYASKVPVIAGIVRDEGSTLFTSFVLSDDKLLKQLDVSWDRLAPKTFSYEGFFPTGKLPWISKRLREFYFGKAPLTKDSLQLLSSLYTDSLFLLPVMHAAGDMAKNGMRVWPYVFTYLSEWSIRDGLKLPDMPGTVGHADDLQYLFPHPVLGRPLQPDSDAEKFSKRLVKFWTTFAKNGEPATGWFEEEPLDWKPIEIPKSSKSTDVPKFDLLRINSDPKVIKTFTYIDRLQFWRKTLREAAGSNSKTKSKGKEKSEL